MGTYISHLRNAEMIFPKIHDLDAEVFLLGNLAPDSGVPNQDGTQFDPPREVTHWLEPGEGEGQIGDLEFYRRHLLDPHLRSDRRRYSFLLGYFVHLVCDNLWSLWIVAALERDYRAMIEARGSQAWNAFKQDWYDLDRKYMRDHQEGRFWRVLVEAEEMPRYLPHFPAEATSEQVRYIRDIYVNPEPGRPLDRDYPYLNEASMDRYVRESSAVALEILSREGELATIKGTQSALSHFPAARLRPYEPPLGDAHDCCIVT